MPYIHKKTFDIIQDSNIDGDLEDYFEVDEPIALPIQELNRKGYATKFCCCGHSFYSNGEAFVSPETKNCDHIIVGAYATEDMPDGSHRILFRNYPVHQAYIIFADDAVLPPAPAGWYYDERSLIRDYSDDLDAFSFMGAMLRSMKDLYRWSQRLPQSGKEQAADMWETEFLFAIKDYMTGSGFQLEGSISDEIESREKGKEYSLSDHIRGLIYSLMTNQTSWKRIVPHLDEVDGIFFQYDIDKIKAQPGVYFSDALFGIKCGNRKTTAQMATLHDNISVLERISDEYGSMDAFVTSAPAYGIVEMLSTNNSKYKLRQVGEALAWEYLRNVGIDGAKPDLHLRRFFGRNRMGYSQRENATVQEVLDAVEQLSAKTGFRKCTIDSLIWSFCADGYGEVCSATPHCNECVINHYCKHQEVRI